MIEHQLGKILHAEFGKVRDYPFLFGLKLTFSLGDGGCVSDGGKYAVNLHADCKWDNPTERSKAIEKNIDIIKIILDDAKVNNVSDLENIPVEVTLENNMFVTFRILKEVL